MRVISLFLIALVATVALPATAQQQTPNIGIVLFDDPANPAGGFFTPFRRALDVAKTRPTVQTVPVPRGEIAAEQAHTERLVDGDKVDLLGTDAPVPLLRRFAAERSSVGFMHLTATDPDQIAALRELKNVITFGFLTARQQDFLAKSMSAMKDSVLVGYGFARPSLDRLVDAAKRAGAGSVDVLTLDRVGTDMTPLAVQLQARKPPLIASLLAEADAEQLNRSLGELKYTNPLVLFSSPPAQTRGFLTGRFIALALAGGPKNGLQVLDWMRSVPRFDRSTQSIEVPWSIRFSNLGDVMQKAGRPEFYGPDGNGTDNTEECSCKDGSGRQVSCKNCEPGKCTRTGDGTDRCSTACKTD